MVDEKKLYSKMEYTKLEFNDCRFKLWKEILEALIEDTPHNVIFYPKTRKSAKMYKCPKCYQYYRFPT